MEVGRAPGESRLKAVAQPHPQEPGLLHPSLPPSIISLLPVIGLATSWSLDGLSSHTQDLEGGSALARFSFASAHVNRRQTFPR